MDSNLNLGERVEAWQDDHRQQDRMAAAASKLIAELDTENRDLASYRIEAEQEAANLRSRLVESDRRLTEALIDVEQLRKRLGLGDEADDRRPDEPELYLVAWHVHDADEMRWALGEDRDGVADVLAWMHKLTGDGVQVRSVFVYFDESKWCSYIGKAAGPAMIVEAARYWIERPPNLAVTMDRIGLAMATDVEIGGLS